MYLLINCALLLPTRFEAEIANPAANIVQCTPTQRWQREAKEEQLCIVVHPIFTRD
jgi:hypothetical protein